jgi:hypothetical protein
MERGDGTEKANGGESCNMDTTDGVDTLVL